MTPARLRLLDELLGEFRVEHAPSWMRPYITRVRRHARDVAAAETVLPVDAVLPDGWWWIDDPADRLAGYDEAGR